MSADILTTFVNRKAELAAFRRILAGETDQRLLLILDQGEQGKTWLLWRLFHECETHTPPLPVARLDFDRRRASLTDFLSVARELRRHLGDDCTPAICACEEQIYRRGPLVSVQTGAGAGSLDFSAGTQGGQIRDSQLQAGDLTGRDRVDVRVGDISQGPPTPDQIARRKAEMGRALRADLTGLAARHPRVVLLLDAFEHASQETCAWLERWLFEPLRGWPHVSLVVAGRPACRAFFEPPRLWTSLVATIDRLAPFSDDDILDHFCRRGLVVDAGEQTLLLDLARPGPAHMGRMGDQLEQSPGRRR